MKKCISFVLALVLILGAALSLTGCHQQNAVVASHDNETITSGMYLIFLINADSQARTKVDEQHAEDDDYDNTTIDYYSMTVTNDDEEEIDFEDYVRTEAEKMMKQYLYINRLAEEKKVAFTEEELAEVESNASFYWSYYGAAYYEPNGVSYETYKEFFVRQQLNYKMFTTLYAVDGEKGVTKADIEKGLSNNYVLARTITVPLTTTNDDGTTIAISDDEKAEAKKKLTAYANNINAKKTTFEKVYEVYNDVDEATSSTTSADQPQPKDDKAVVYGAEDTASASEYFTDIQELIKEHGVGHAAVIADASETNYLLVVTADIMGDSYYYDAYLEEVLDVLYADEYETMIDENSSEIDLEIDTYELNYLDPEKISYDQAY